MRQSEMGAGISRDRARVVALVPAYNEAARIALTVRALQEIRAVGRILVIDDGSTDDTLALARSSGADTLALERNHGKGGAVQRGLEYLGDWPDVVLFIDGDLAETAGEARRLLEPVLADEADMTIGDLPSPGRPGGMGLVMRLANWAIQRRTGRRMREPLSGQRAIRRSLLEDVRLSARYGLEVGLTVAVLERGGRVLEVPVEMSHAHTGRNLAGFLHRGRQFVDVLRAALFQPR